VHPYKRLIEAFLRNYVEPLPIPDRVGEGTVVGNNQGKAYAEIDKCYAEVVGRLTRDTVSTE
jgi:hypothetical protein